MLFAGLQQRNFDRIQQPINDPEFEPGQHLYRQGEDTAHVFTIRSGLVKLVLRLPGQDELAGLESLDSIAANHDAITMDHVKLYRIPKTLVTSMQRPCFPTALLHHAPCHPVPVVPLNKKPWAVC